MTSASDLAALYNFTYDALGRTTQILASVTGMSQPVVLPQRFNASGNRSAEILQNQVGDTAASAVKN